jgi:hypothetical protein
MSTAEPETPDTENPDAEPTPSIEGDDADAEEHEAEQETAPTPEFDASAEQWRQLDAANDAYIKKVVKIVGEDAPLVGCEHCSGRGFTLGEQEPEVPMVHPDNLVSCDACNGYGEIITGSRNPTHITSVCTACAGNGFITKPVVQAPAYVPPAAPVITAQQAQYGTMLPDGTFVPLGAPAPALTNAYTP